MLEKVIMPTLGLGIEEAVIIQWLKREGESVVRDEPLLMVETDKATTEINAPATGLLRQIAYPDGSTVPVTRTIAMIETETEPGTTAKRPEQITDSGASSLPPASPHTPSSKPVSMPPDVPGVNEGAVRASPAARRLARELRVTLADLTGTGLGGRIQGEDVRKAAERRQELAAPVRTERPATQEDSRGQAVMGLKTEAHLVPGLPGRLVPFNRKRRVTAERMAASARSVARVTLNAEVDAGELITLRSRLQPAFQQQGVRLTYDAMLAKIVAEALSAHPEMNARWTDNGIYVVEPVNVGVAMAAADGLVVPVIREASRKRLLDVARELTGLLEKAKADKLTADDMTGGTFTITNLGMFGVDSFAPIVNPPECAILGVGRMAERPVGRDGQLVLRPTMVLSLSFDHRVVDGVPAGRFLQRIAQLIQEPYLLL